MRKKVKRNLDPIDHAYKGQTEIYPVKCLPRKCEAYLTGA